MSSVGSVMSAELAQWLQVYMADSNSRMRLLTDQKDSLEVKRGIYTDLKSKLAAIRSLADDMKATGSLSQFAAKSTTLSETGIFSATATQSASSLTHTIHVQHLARSHTIVSDRFTQSGTELSAAHAGTKTFTVTVDGTAYDVSVEIGAGDTNEDVIAAVALAINDATDGDPEDDDSEDVGIGASKIQDSSTTAKLTIMSDETGLANKMSFTDTDGLLGTLGITTAVEATDTTGGYIHADADLDARLTVDGINVTSASNTVDQVITGVTLQLLGEQEDTDLDVSLTVAPDTEGITEKVNEFLTAYNEAYSYLKGKIAVDAETYARGDLAGEYAYVSLWQNMRQTLTQSITPAAAGGFASLSQIGITAGVDGNFSITDTDDFEEALSEKIDEVEALFTGEDGLATRLEDLLDDYSGAAGIITSSTDSVNSRIDILDDRIDRMTVLQEMEQEQLIKQYGALQQALYDQQTMMAMLSSLNSY